MCEEVIPGEVAVEEGVSLMLGVVVVVLKLGAILARLVMVMVISRVGDTMLSHLWMVMLLLNQPKRHGNKPYEGQRYGH
jgi:hypothetical protein